MSLRSLRDASSGASLPAGPPGVAVPAQGFWRRRLHGASGVTAVLLATAVLIGFAWIGTLSAIHLRRIETEIQATHAAADRARVLEQDLHRQLLAIDQTLLILAQAWQANPDGFDLQTWHTRTTYLDDLTHETFLTDPRGVVTVDTDPASIGTNFGAAAFFRRLSAQPAGTPRTILSRAERSADGGWRIEIALPLFAAPNGAGQGKFAGSVGVVMDTTALVRLAPALPPLPGMLVQVVGRIDGALRASQGVPGIDPGTTIAGSAEFAAMADGRTGEWTGRSALDGQVRIHAFHPVADTALDVVVALDRQQVLDTMARWERGAILFASGITVLLLLLAAGGLRELHAARRREAALVRDRHGLASANAGLALAKIEAERHSAQLQAILAGMSDGVSLVDGSLRLVAWNPSFPGLAGVPARLLRVGLPMEEMLRVQAEAGQFGPVDPVAEVGRRMALLRAGSHRGVMERMRPDGRIVELRRNPLPDGGFVTLYTDITVRKQAEDALRAGRSQAEAASDAKSRFVAIVSHEIRSPLNALLNALSLLGESGLDASRMRLLDMARHSGEALFGLLNDILEMSRMEAGHLTLRPVSFVLAGLLESVLAMFSAQAERRGISLSLTIAAGVPDEIHADPGRLRQIMINLIGNAAKFADPGIVALSVETVFVDGRTVLRLAVRDTGPPIDPADRARLFEPFSQLEREGGAIQPGSGLGLAICRQLAALMGGEMGCDLAAGTAGAPGNMFWLSLPLIPAAGLTEAGPALPEARARAEAAAFFARQLPRTRILLVEDVLANQIVTATQLRREGHLVDIAATGEAALEAAVALPYDLIFMDVFMPGLSGMEVTRRIRRLGGMVASVRIVALTANVAPAEEAECLAAGMDAVLGKPVTLAVLSETIARQVWGRRAARRPVLGARVNAAFSEDAAMLLPITAPEPPMPDDAMLLAPARLAELRDNLPPDTLAELVAECLADLAERLAGLERSLALGDVGAIAAETHAMVGMAAGYGMAALEARLRAVMDAARVADGGRAARAAAGPAGTLEGLRARSAAALGVLLADGEQVAGE